MIRGSATRMNRGQVWLAWVIIGGLTWATPAAGGQAAAGQPALSAPATPGPAQSSPPAAPGQPSAPDRRDAIEQLNRIGRDLLSSPGQRDAAIEEIKKMLTADPGFAEAHLWLGVAYRLIGTPEMTGEAVAELRQAIDLSPGLIPARVYLAQAYTDLGRPERSR